MNVLKYGGIYHLLNNMILKKLIKLSGKCNPKSKTSFYFAFHLRNSKSRN